MTAAPPLRHLDGFTPWPNTVAERYRELGYWRGEPLGAMLARVARQHPGRTALICGKRHISYRYLDERASQLAAGFARLGIAPQDRVIVQLPNIAEFFIACFALFRLGAIPVMALPAHRSAEIGFFAETTGATAYVIADRHGGFDYRTLARDVQAHNPALQHVVVVGDAAEFTDLDALYTEPAAQANVDASQVALMQLSGGSTGTPKLIPRTHDDYLYSVLESARICGFDADTVYLAALPVSHNFPLSSPGTLGTLCVGGTVVLARDPSPETAFPLIATHQVSVTALVPALALLWLQAAPQHAPLASLRMLQVGGARLSVEAARKVRPLLGCQLQQVFGMAEGLVNYTRAGDPEDLVIQTQGCPISPHDEIRVVDDDDIDVPHGETGHLLTRGPYTIRGYYKAAEHNARAFTADGFYRTGDRVRLTPEGYLVVEGRSKDQINRGGEKIAAEEVENHLLSHPQVRNAALVAMPDNWLGEKSCAFIELTGPSETPALRLALQLKTHLQGRGLAAYKIPDHIEFVDALPLTALGKVSKEALRHRLARSA
ncbi:(2,3-dihydroxybenzoyl)adenylate synthase [Jeongeupia chitinilytica]|uniref:2,3-dihydroxybenzoate-AMP ligase n=1 Tax=Jeongeupia chitinilytica TaxID=1041641 RepID=A0ABQ3GZI1_9NEIS|nr:(2,3-dihydroxybenzoyl)adenylate synthase [Jeongeupia chitinilytica]GHD57456.1 2,3-dihydroxybenzoate-AMP ligase [Jeongeupia chitinilytica]